MTRWQSKFDQSETSTLEHALGFLERLNQPEWESLLADLLGESPSSSVRALFGPSREPLAEVAAEVLADLGTSTRRLAGEALSALVTAGVSAFTEGGLAQAQIGIRYSVLISAPLRTQLLQSILESDNYPGHLRSDAGAALLEVEPPIASHYWVESPVTGVPGLLPISIAALARSTPHKAISLLADPEALPEDLAVLEAPLRHAVAQLLKTSGLGSLTDLRGALPVISRDLLDRVLEFDEFAGLDLMDGVVEELLPNRISVTDIARIERSIPGLRRVLIVADQVEAPEKELYQAVEINLCRNVQYEFLVSGRWAQGQIRGYYLIYEGLVTKARYECVDGPVGDVSIQQMPDNWDDYPYIFYTYESPESEGLATTVAFCGTQLKEGIAEEYVKVPRHVAFTLFRSLFTKQAEPIIEGEEAKPIIAGEAPREETFVEPDTVINGAQSA